VEVKNRSEMENVGVQSPVPEVLESAALSIGAMIEPLPAPAYVKTAAQGLVDALNRWAAELRG
jgi:hypothetical protein